MKKTLVSKISALSGYAITSVVLLAVAGIGYAVARKAQAFSENALYRQLGTKGDDSVVALDKVLETPESVSAMLLYEASGVAFRGNRLEDSGYLFYVAGFRAQFDREMFPPVGTGGNSPMVLFGALQQQMGSVVSPALMSEPKVFSKVFARLKTWVPKASWNYNPGWEFSARRSKQQAAASLQDRKKKFLEDMGGICTLLQDDAYFAAFRIAQDYNLTLGEGRPSKDAFDAAMETMRRIETELGLLGLASAAEK